MLAIFQFTPVLWAGSAVAAPVIIHMILRTKARRVKFPAIEFIRKSHRSNIKINRLKHLLLMLMRMAAMALVVLLIARWSVGGWRTVAATTEPTAAAVVVDNSGSMGYVSGGKTLLAVGKDLAAKVVRSLPAGSVAAVVTTQAPEKTVGLTGDLKRAGEQVAAVEGTVGHAPLAPAVRQAVSLLDNVKDLKVKCVYLVTDMTAQAWRDGGGARAVADKDKKFVVLNCGVKDGNSSLGDLRLSAWSAPVGGEVDLRTMVRRAQQGPELSLSVELDGQQVYQKILDDAPAGGARPLSVLIQPTKTGVQAGKVSLGGLAGRDPLEMDNERYFTLQVASPAQLAVVADRATLGADDATVFLMEMAVAPRGGEVAGGQWVRRVSLASDSLDAARLKGADIVLLANVSALSPAQWVVLRNHVEAGAHLWIVPGRLVSPAGYNLPEAQALMPVELGPLSQEPREIGWQAPAAQGADALLQPFLSGENPPLTGVRCQRRFAVKSTAEGARVVLRYTDGVPAIVERNVGEGSVTLWNFSPTRDFSNLARMEQFVVLTQRTLQLMLGGWDTMYAWGEPVAVPLPKRLSGPTVEVSRPGEDFRRVTGSGGRTFTIPAADRLGQWRVRFTQGDESELAGFSVNAPASESDLRPAKEQDVREMFPPGRLLITAEAAQALAGEETSQDLDLTGLVLIALLLLATAESFFANRFYKPKPQPEGAPAGGEEHRG